MEGGLKAVKNMEGKPMITTGKSTTRRFPVSLSITKGNKN
jgi:hypothetical protein